MRKNCHIFVSEDDYLLKEKVDGKISEIAGKNRRSVSITYLNVNEITPQVVSDIITPNFFSSKQIFVFGGLEKLKSGLVRLYIRMLGNLPEFSHIIIYGNKAPEHKSFSELKKNAYFVEIKSPRKGKVNFYIFEEARRANLKLSRDAVDFINDMAHGSLHYIAELFSKLRSAGVKGELSLSEIQKFASYGVGGYKMYELGDAISKKDLRKILIIVDALFSDGVSRIDIIRALGFHFRNLFSAKLMLSRGDFKGDIVKKLRIFSWKADSFFDELSSYSIEKLAFINKELLDLDLAAKTTSLDISDEIKAFIIRAIK